MKKSVKIITLPTEDKTLLVSLRMFGKDKLHLCETILPIQDEERYMHVYVTVSQDVEPIKDGDWFYNSFNDNQPKIQQRKGDWKQCFNQRKIIATTDPKLTIWKQCEDCKSIGKHVGCNLCKKANIPQLSQSFLKEYVANPNREWEVEYEKKSKGFINALQGKYNYEHKLKLNQDNTVNISLINNSKERKVFDWLAKNDYLSDDVEILYKEWLKNNLI